MPTVVGYGLPADGKYTVWTTMSRNDFFYLYSGDAGPGAVANMLLTRRLAVKWFALHSLQAFASSFDYSNSNWMRFYKSRGEMQDAARMMEIQWSIAEAQQPPGVVNEEGSIVSVAAVGDIEAERLRRMRRIEASLVQEDAMSTILQTQDEIVSQETMTEPLVVITNDAADIEAAATSTTTTTIPSLDTATTAAADDDDVAISMPLGVVRDINPLAITTAAESIGGGGGGVGDNTTSTTAITRNSSSIDSGIADLIALLPSLLTAPSPPAHALPDGGGWAQTWALPAHTLTALLLNGPDTATAALTARMAAAEASIATSAALSRIASDLTRTALETRTLSQFPQAIHPAAALAASAVGVVGALVAAALDTNTKGDGVSSITARTAQSAGAAAGATAVNSHAATSLQGASKAVTAMRLDLATARAAHAFGLQLAAAAAPGQESRARLSRASLAAVLHPDDDTRLSNTLRAWSRRHARAARCEPLAAWTIWGEGSTVCDKFDINTDKNTDQIEGGTSIINTEEDARNIDATKNVASSSSSSSSLSHQHSLRTALRGLVLVRSLLLAQHTGKTPSHLLHHPLDTLITPHLPGLQVSTSALTLACKVSSKGEGGSENETPTTATAGHDGDDDTPHFPTKIIERLIALRDSMQLEDDKVALAELTRRNTSPLPSTSLSLSSLSFGTSATVHADESEKAAWVPELEDSLERGGAAGETTGAPPTPPPPENRLVDDRTALSEIAIRLGTALNGRHPLAPLQMKGQVSSRIARALAWLPAFTLPEPEWILLDEKDHHHRSSPPPLPRALLLSPSCYSILHTWAAAGATVLDIHSLETLAWTLGTPLRAWSRAPLSLDAMDLLPPSAAAEGKEVVVLEEGSANTATPQKALIPIWRQRRLFLGENSLQHNSLTTLAPQSSSAAKTPTAYNGWGSSLFNTTSRARVGVALSDAFDVTNGLSRGEGRLNGGGGGGSGGGDRDDDLLSQNYNYHHPHASLAVEVLSVVLSSGQRLLKEYARAGPLSRYTADSDEGGGGGHDMENGSG